VALVPTNKYAGQITTGDAGWPLGKAKNITVAGDGTGTPLEADWVNDIWGFQQALMLESGITPNEAPDSANNSQYLGAIKAIIADYMPIRWIGSVSCAPTTPVVTTSWGPAPDSVAYFGPGLDIRWTSPPWEQASSNLMSSLVASLSDQRDRYVTGGLSAGADIFSYVWDAGLGAEVTLDGSYQVINFAILGTKI